MFQVKAFLRVHHGAQRLPFFLFILILPHALLSVTLERAEQIVKLARRASLVRPPSGGDRYSPDAGCVRGVCVV